MAKASELIKVAQSWIGKKESDGTHKDIIDIYNSHRPLARGYAVKYTDSWCATTISALSIICNATDIIPTECSCQKMIELFKKLGVWIENENRTPKAGDIIFYDWSDSGSGDNKGYSDHVGIVEKVSNGTITVIEGNYMNSVARRYISVNGKYIRGYAVPKYSPESSTNTSDSKGCGYMFAPETVKKGCEGNSVLLMQTLLRGKGYKGKDGKELKLDKKCGTNSVYALNSYQTDRRKTGVELGTNGKNDSSCGPKMWADLIGL